MLQKIIIIYKPWRQRFKDSSNHESFMSLTKNQNAMPDNAINKERESEGGRGFPLFTTKVNQSRCLMNKKQKCSGLQVFSVIISEIPSYNLHKVVYEGVVRGSGVKH